MAITGHASRTPHDITTATASKSRTFKGRRLENRRLTFDDLRVSPCASLQVNGRVSPGARPSSGRSVEPGAPLLAAIKSPDIGQWLSDVREGAEPTLVAAEHELQRQTEALQRSRRVRAGALKDLETAENTWHKAKAEARAGAVKIAAAQGGRASTRSAREFLLRSPIAGEVIARNASPGLEVQGQYTMGGNVVELYTIGATDQLWVIGDVYEMDRPRIKEGDEVTRLAWAPTRQGPVQRDGRLGVGRPRAALHTASARALRHPEPRAPAQARDVRVAQASWCRASRVLAVPRGAAARRDNGTVVFVATGQKRRPTAPSSSSAARSPANETVGGDVLPVLSGLHPGDVVAVDHAVLLLGML